MLVGRKTGTTLKSVETTKLGSIFVSRLNPDITVEAVVEFVKGSTGEEPKVEKLSTKFPNHSSFKIVCNQNCENAILNPDEWEEGILIRRYFERKSYRTRNWSFRAGRH